MNDHPPSPEQFELLLPLAVAWAEEQEKRILDSGVALTPAQIRDARAVGVAHPEQVRLFMIGAIPMPEHPVLRAAGEATGLISPFTAGLTLRYGIYIRSDLAGDRGLIAHELVHTGQYERRGSVHAFLREYLHECLTIGYPAAPMEQEAITVSARVLRESH
jgi:hypothetical protein